MEGLVVLLVLVVLAVPVTLIVLVVGQSGLRRRLEAAEQLIAALQRDSGPVVEKAPAVEATSEPAPARLPRVQAAPPPSPLRSSHTRQSLSRRARRRLWPRRWPI